MRNYHHFQKVTLLFAVFFISQFFLGCGGGTTGTGSQTYQGVVKNTENIPLENVKVTIVETGETDTTDPQGEFSIPTNALLSEVNIRIEGENIDATYKVKSVAADDSKVRVNVVVDEVTRTVSVVEFAAQVGMVGQCDRYFENNEVIRQANRIPSGTVCSLKVVLYGDGVLQPDLPVQLQYRSCDPFGAWKVLETGRTGVGIKRGVAQISFEYKSTRTFCEYRVLAPINVKGSDPLDYRIETFRYQERKNQ